MTPPEVGEEDRQAGVDRAPPAMNDAGPREGQPKQPEQLEIRGLLVGHPPCIGRDPAEHSEIVSPVHGTLPPVVGRQFRRRSFETKTARSAIRRLRQRQDGRTGSVR